MKQSIPRFNGYFSEYLGDLRTWVFQKQIQAADYFGVNHTTISRYENGKLTPPLSYVFQLIKLVVERFQTVTPLTPATRQAILEDINSVIQTVYPGHPFIKSWSEFWNDRPHSPPETASRHQGRIHWSGAPSPGRFYGRHQELDTLDQWIIHEQSRIVALLGIGGIGKTSLAVQFCLYAQNLFEDILWISLRNAPLPGDVLTDCIRFFSQQQQDGRSNSITGQIDTLMEIFRHKRCLLVIDNFESVLLEGESAGTYRGEYSHYGYLLKEIGTSIHQSCILLTSREKPKEVVDLEGDASKSHSLILNGLGSTEARQILLDGGKNLDDSPENLNRIVEQVVGNPLVLQWLPSLIDFYAGDIDRLLDDGAVITGDIFPLLQQQFQRLAPVEVDILFWLAIEREAVSLKQFQEVLLSASHRTDLLNGLSSLQRRSLIENNRQGFLLQNLVMEYVTYLFVSQVTEEIITGKIRYFNSHALYRVQTKEFITQAQRRLIVHPIAERLLKHFWKPASLQQKFTQILDILRQDGSMAPGYAAGNILRLMGESGMDLTGADFSHLPLWDVDLRNKQLHQVNLHSCDLSRAAFTEVFGRVLCLAFNPTGSILAAGTTDGEILLVRMEDFSLQLAIQGHTDWVRSVAFNPSGTLLMSASDDSKIKLWDLATGQCQKTLLGHVGRVMTAVFHPKQPIVASGGEDGLIHLWNLRTGVCEHTIAGHFQWVYTLQFTADGHQLISGSSDQTIKVWDFDPMNCLMTLSGNTGAVWTLAIHPDNLLLASSGSDQSVKLWQMDTGELFRTLASHPTGIRSVAFSPDGKFLAVSSGESVYLYETNSGTLAARLTGHTSTIWAVLFSPDGFCLASAAADKTIRFWSTQDHQCLFTLCGYQNAIPAVAFDPVQRDRLVSGCDDGTIRVWDTSTGQCLKTIDGHKDRIKRVSLSETGEFLATAGDDSMVRLWDAAHGTFLSTYPIQSIGSICFDKTGQRLITCSSLDRLIWVWNTATGQAIQTLDAENAEFYWLAVSPDNRILAASGEALGEDGGKIYLWDLTSGERLNNLAGHREAVWAVTFDPHGRYLYSGGSDGTVRVWDYHAFKEIYVLTGHQDQVKALAVHPQGNILASAGQDSVIRIWDTHDFSCRFILTGHVGAILSLSFNATGTVLCSTGLDETMRLWNAETGAPLKVLKIPPPYQGMNVHAVTGIHPAQMKKLKDLGAVDEG